MSNRNETFGRLLKGAINSIAAYEGKTAPAVEEDLGAQIGLAGSALQRYKAGYLPPEVRTVEIIANAAMRRGYLGRAWLQPFLQAARYPTPDALIARLVGDAPAPTPRTSVQPGGTVTFLFTDIEGSTRLWEEHPVGMQRALARHDSILRQAITSNDGYIFKTVGDAFCAAFATAPQAVSAALASQRLLLAEPWSAGGLPMPILVRMAIHTGAAEERDGDYFGQPLNRTARLLAAGHGGQVLLSNATQELTRDHLLPEVILRDLGEHRLKDLGRPERIFQLVGSDLPSSFPALISLDAYRHNLPPQPTPLIGREREVEAVVDMLRDPDVRMLTLTGPGGTGKTRLALQTAGELLDSFADGVWFVGLASVSDPEMVASTITAVLGVREHGERALAEVLKFYLREKELLLLLDDFEPLTGAAPLLAELLRAAPKIKILITSRAALHLYGECEYAVPPLALPERAPLPPLERLTQYEAVRLFIERARAVRADFAVTAANAPAIAEICHRLDGLPLAIELAAARSKIFAPPAILARLDRRLATLTGGARDLPMRQQTLRGAIDWSYNLLDAAEQELFARLGVFTGGCTVEAVEALLADGDVLIDALDGLTSLVDKSLLRQIEGPDDEPRFVMLETIREYALERLLATREEAALRRRHALHFLAMAEQAELQLHGAEQVIVQQCLEAEHDNIRSALAWSQTQEGITEIGVRLAVASWWFWMVRGYWSEGISWLTQMLAQAPETGVMRAKLLLGLGYLARLRGNLSTASAFFEQSLAISRSAGDRRGVAQGLSDLGSVVALQGDYRRAGGLLDESLAIYQELDEPWGSAWLAFNQGFVAEDQDDAARAVALFTESLARFRTLGDRWGTARALMRLGKLAIYQGNTAEAVPLLMESLALARDMGDVWCITFVLTQLGLAALQQRDEQRAAYWFEESLVYNRQRGDTDGIAFSLLSLGRLARLQNNLWQAVQLLQESLDLYRGLDVTMRIVEVSQELAAVEQEQGNLK